MIAFIRMAIVFVMTVALGTALVSITSTHIILHGLTEVGAAIPLDVRLDAVLRDLSGFAPILGVLLTIGFFVAFLVASIIIRNFIPTPTLGYTLAGFAAVIIMMIAIYWFYYFDGLGAIHPVPAARTMTGLIAMGIAGSVAGFFFANFYRARR